MRKNILYLTTIAILIFLGACNSEAFLIENDNEALHQTNPTSGRTISFTVNMPDENPTTRIDLNQEADKSITLTWDENDEIQFAFVQGDTKVKSISTVSSISNDGKNAQFVIEIPTAIEEGAFNLYGVYGGGGLSDDDPTHVILPKNTDEGFSLENQSTADHQGIKARRDVMLYFAAENIETTASDVSFNFQHLGSLFCVSVKNTNTALFGGERYIKNVKELRLVGVGDDDKWAYNVGESGGSYDLVNGEFLNTESASNYFSFYTPWSGNLDSGGVSTFWAWYPPLPEKDYPELKLELHYPRTQENTLIATSINSKPARNAATNIGKVNYIYATWNGLDLEFTDENFTPPNTPPTELSVENWESDFYPGDTPAISSTYPLSLMWDGSLSGTSRFESSDTGDVNFPISFSIDLGENQDKTLTHIRVFHASTNRLWRWNRFTPNKWEIWGSNNPAVDDSWDSWTKIADCEATKPSGGYAHDDLSNVDEDLAKIAEVYKFSNPGVYRYLRFRIISTWANNPPTNKKIRLWEIRLYGVDEPSSFILDASLPSLN